MDDAWGRGSKPTGVHQQGHAAQHTVVETVTMDREPWDAAAPTPHTPIPLLSWYLNLRFN